MDFKSFFKGKDGAPNIAQLMMKITPLLIPGGDRKKAINGLVTEFATDENVHGITRAIIEGLAKLQQEQATRYVLKIESTHDSNDIAIIIYTRSSDMTQLVEFGKLFLSQLNQEQIIILINLLTNEHTNSTTAGI